MFTDGSQRRIVVIIPHSNSEFVDMTILSQQLNQPITRLSLTALQKEFGFPTFINPPFGHEYAPNVFNKPVEERSEIFTVIDSRLVREGSTDCFFDLGIVGMIVRPVDLGRLAQELGWVVLDNIVSKKLN
jgi:hypothetical protein